MEPSKITSSVAALRLTQYLLQAFNTIVKEEHARQALESALRLVPIIGKIYSVKGTECHAMLLERIGDIIIIDTGEHRAWFDLTRSPEARAF